MSSTSMPDSSKTSRVTQPSRLSPGSTNPASTECMPFGHCGWRPNRARSPSCTSTIAAGSVRGKWWVRQSGLVQSRWCPAWPLTVGCPQTPQNRWRTCHQVKARACASSAPSLCDTSGPTARRSANRTSPPNACCPSSSSASPISTAKWQMPLSWPRKIGSSVVLCHGAAAAGKSAADGASGGPVTALRPCQTGSSRLAGSASRAAIHPASPRRHATRSRLGWV